MYEDSDFIKWFSKTIQILYKAKQKRISNNEESCAQRYNILIHVSYITLILFFFKTNKYLRNTKVISLKCDKV